MKVFLSCCGRQVLAAVRVVIAVILVRFANDGSDARARRSPDDGSLQAAAEECAENRSARCADGRAFPWPDAALVAVVATVISAMVVVRMPVVVPTAAPGANAVVELTLIAAVIPTLGVGRKNHCGKQRDEK